MSTNQLKPHVVAAFIEAGIPHTGADVVVNSTCSVLYQGRYVAFYGAHGGWQIAKSAAPKGRVTVSRDQAIAWALKGEWADGTACLNGYAVKDGKEMGRKPVETQTSTQAMQSVSVDDAKARKAKALFRLISGETLTKEEIADLLG